MSILETSHAELLTTFGRISDLQAKLQQSQFTADQKRTLSKIDLRLNGLLNGFKSVLVDLEKLGGAS